MRVLWVCNIMLPLIAKELGVESSNKEGWLTGLSQRILESTNAEIELGICFPASSNDLSGRTKDGSFCYYGFVEDTLHEETYDAALEGRMKEIMADFKPDLIHIFGTEYGHTLAALRAFGKPEKSLVGIQGVCTACAREYLYGIPDWIAKRTTFRDFIKKDNLQKQKAKMEMRGLRETEALALTGHVTGRTDFDREEAYKANPKAKYHFMNETLRGCFYQGSWELENCERHSVFVSQANYPLKGFHFVLEALPELIVRYPDIKVYVAGDSIVRGDSLTERLKISGYGKYLKELIEQKNIKEHVVFIGQTDAPRMKERFCKAHVFVSASAIENSPNSVGEAMLLGVPVVASNVGGVPSMVTDGEEALLYPANDVKALAEAVCRIFESDELALALSEKSRIRAHKTHNPDINFGRLLEIYHEINLCEQLHQSSSDSGLQSSL